MVVRLARSQSYLSQNSFEGIDGDAPVTTQYNWFE